jgi:molybdopterin-guanine dinucleotide biosynthesis protein A
MAICDITGVVLAGGFSSRMGSNKSLLEIDGYTMIERTHDLLKKIFGEVITSTNEPELFEFLNSTKVKDIYPHLGPLAGIHSALSTVKANKIFLISCDMPFIQPSIINYLLKIETEEMIVLPKAKDRIQYFCGIYDKQILSVVESILKAVSEAKCRNEEVKNSALSMWNFIERMGAEIVDVEYERFYFNDLFFNINTPEDFEYAKSRVIY